MRKYRKYIYTIIGILILAIIGFYAWHYHGSVSTNINDWSAFANYFNGLIAPFLAIVNIIVFIELTIAISDLDKKKSENEMKLQKALLKMQFRRQSVEEFSQQMNKLFRENRASTIEKAYNEAIDYLEKFIRTDFKYFDYTNLPETKEKLDKLLRNLRIIIQYIVTNRECGHDIYLERYTLTSEIIESLMASMLDEIDKTE